MTADALGIPDGPIDIAPIGFMPSAAQEALLREVLAAAGVELGVYDQRIVQWLATWDWSTFAPVAAWIKQAARE